MSDRKREPLSTIKFWADRDDGMKRLDTTKSRKRRGGMGSRDMSSRNMLNKLIQTLGLRIKSRPPRGGVDRNKDETNGTNGYGYEMALPPQGD